MEIKWVFKLYVNHDNSLDTAVFHNFEPFHSLTFDLGMVWEYDQWSINCFKLIDLLIQIH